MSLSLAVEKGRMLFGAGMMQWEGKASNLEADVNNRGFKPW